MAGRELPLIAGAAAPKRVKGNEKFLFSLKKNFSMAQEMPSSRWWSGGERKAKGKSMNNSPTLKEKILLSF